VQKWLNADEKSTSVRRNKRRIEKAKDKQRDNVSTLSDLYPSTCLTWEVLPVV